MKKSDPQDLLLFGQSDFDSYLDLSESEHRIGENEDIRDTNISDNNLPDPPLVNEPIEIDYQHECSDPNHIVENKDEGNDKSLPLVPNKKSLLDNEAKKIPSEEEYKPPLHISTPNVLHRMSTKSKSRSEPQGPIFAILKYVAMSQYTLKQGLAKFKEKRLEGS